MINEFVHSIQEMIGATRQIESIIFWIQLIDICNQYSYFDTIQVHLNKLDSCPYRQI